MSVYRIAKWSETFETADSRRHKSLTWVSMPIDFCSSGYQSMVEDFGDDAPAVYGAWMAVVSIAANCPTRGLLANSRGKALTIERIARLAYMPVEPFEMLFGWATADGIGWLELVDDSTSNDSQPVANQSANSGDCLSNELPNLTQPNLTLPNHSLSAISERDDTPNDSESVDVADQCETDSGEIQATADRVIQAWSNQRGAKPIRKMSKQRRAKLIRRLRDPDWPWEDAIAKLPIPNTKTFTWQPTFDWLINNDENAYKLAEGSYDQPASVGGADTGAGKKYQPPPIGIGDERLGDPFEDEREQANRRLSGVF